MPTLMNYTLDSATGSSTQPDALYKLTASVSSRTTDSVTIKFTVYGKLEGSDHWLGTGHTLTASVYIGDEWYSWTLKKSTSSWSGTTAHSASKSIKIDVTASQTSITGIKFKVKHTGGDACPLNSRTVSDMTIPTTNDVSEVILSKDEVFLDDTINAKIKAVNTTNVHSLSIIERHDTDSENITNYTTIKFLPTEYVGSQIVNIKFDTDDYIKKNIFDINSDNVKLEILCVTYDSAGTYIGSSSTPITLTIPEDIGRPGLPSILDYALRDDDASLWLIPPTEYFSRATFQEWKIISNIGEVRYFPQIANYIEIDWPSDTKENVIATIIAVDSRGLESKPIYFTCYSRKTGFCILSGSVWRKSSPYIYTDGQYKRLHGAVYNNGSWSKHYYRGEELTYLTDTSGNYLTNESGNILKL